MLRRQGNKQAGQGQKAVTLSSWQSEAVVGKGKTLAKIARAKMQSLLRRARAPPEAHLNTLKGRPVRWAYSTRATSSAPLKAMPISSPKVLSACRGVPSASKNSAVAGTGARAESRGAAPSSMSKRRGGAPDAANAWCSLPEATHMIHDLEGGLCIQLDCNGIKVQLLAQLLLRRLPLSNCCHIHLQVQAA